MEEEDKKKKVDKKQEQKYIVTEVATQTAQVVLDTETEEKFDIPMAICKIMNDISELKEQLIN